MNTTVIDFKKPKLVGEIEKLASCLHLQDKDKDNHIKWTEHWSSRKST